MEFRVGQGFDFHPLVSNRPLVVCGVKIDYPLGLKGHSDADVGSHALANAILGATGKGDLGRHFPDSDERYRNADSLNLLAEIWRTAREDGYGLVNADLTIFAQQPKLGPYMDRMRARLAELLRVHPSALNVKASNPEGLGALGRGEGMAASAIVMLKKD